MQQNNSSSTPFYRLGLQLKRIRQAAKESLVEASGAVEVDSTLLERYESGEVRPTEDILMLLISHFDVKDEEADTLWHLAGFDKKRGSDGELQQQAVIILPMDSRIVYTDMINVSMNNFGVVMNFLQQGVGGQPDQSATTRQASQPMAVARVGMSLDHARSVFEVLRYTLDQAEKQAQQHAATHMLPPPQNAAAPGNTQKTRKKRTPKSDSSPTDN